MPASDQAVPADQTDETDERGGYLAVMTRYLSALADGDTAALVALFAPDGIVVSPLHGPLPAPAFFAELARESRSSELTTLDLMLSATGRPQAAAYFRYRWTVRNGTVVVFDCCDVFEFVPPAGGDRDGNGDRDGAGGPKIRQLTILYDTAPVRARIGLG